MKLRSLYPTSKLAINMQVIARKLGLRIVTEEVTPSDGLVVIGDGSPDDQAFVILAHSQDGDKVVRIVKPGIATGLNVIAGIRTYLDLKARNIMILVDQEEFSADDLIDKAMEVIPSYGISLLRTDRPEGRFAIFSCELGNKEFTLLLMINGLDEVETTKHTIEDHLMKAAGMYIHDMPDTSGNDSKEAWRMLTESQQTMVFRKLSETRELNTIFPQQVRGCEYLKARLG